MKLPQIMVGMILRKTLIILKQFRQNISETIILQKLWFEIYFKIIIVTSCILTFMFIFFMDIRLALKYIFYCSRKNCLKSDWTS